MFLISDLFVCQFYYKLYATYFFYPTDRLVKSFFIDDITLHQPQKIKVFEFGKQIFSVEPVIVQVMKKRARGFTKFVHCKKIIPFLLGELYFYVIVDAKIHFHSAVQMPAKLVVLDGGHNSEQPCIFKKIVRKIFIV